MHPIPWLRQRAHEHAGHKVRGSAGNNSVLLYNMHTLNQSRQQFGGSRTNVWGALQKRAFKGFRLSVHHAARRSSRSLLFRNLTSPDVVRH